MFGICQSAPSNKKVNNYLPVPDNQAEIDRWNALSLHYLCSTKSLEKMDERRSQALADYRAKLLAHREIDSRLRNCLSLLRVCLTAKPSAVAAARPWKGFWQVRGRHQGPAVGIPLTFLIIYIICFLIILKLPSFSCYLKFPSCCPHFSPSPFSFIYNFHFSILFNLKFPFLNSIQFTISISQL